MSKGKKNCSKSKEKENKMEMFMEGLLETCENKEVIWNVSHLRTIKEKQLYLNICI